MNRTSIPRPRAGEGRRPIRTTSLRALAVAAHLERGLGLEGPPGRDRAGDEDEARTAA
ncbi:hypothetical protein [Thermomonospora umbrina]|uniref:Uncharacterized protein n=1 Tax=Thermomonospora umbrina TaxID=111806 RepID=A0A3D9SKP4_9ACTN|nr:hypothetical protein [Thermomonospora umbrina]REE96277.1 hypothetical protein DFJ69_1707 [Thermomonospora umbrina]